MKANKVLFTLLSIGLLSSCSRQITGPLVKINNPIDIQRSLETVELSKSFLNIKNLDAYGVKDIKTNKIIVSQLVDNDNNGSMDAILFQANVPAKASSTYQVVKLNKEDQPEAKLVCYSRFVPERTDDYAWENDKVAFRIFGPNAQYRTENKLKQGTLSSGVDAWLKRVDYPIINSWYARNTKKRGAYHHDIGEGLDNFHVGVSRGVGGIAYKKDSTYYLSKNFTKWKTITTGPIRTSFYVEYANWGPEGQIKESRIISLDKGNNLTKFDINIEGVNTVSAGLTLHEKDGVVSSKENQPWLNYWQPHPDSELGTAIVTTTKHYAGQEKYDVEAKDLSNAYAHLKVIDNKVVYYAGFAWSTSGQFKNKADWENYLSNFAKKIEHPLTIELTK